MARLQVTLCIPTWNNETTIRAVLDNVQRAVDEIQILDQFSTDNTIPFLMGRGAIIHQLMWNGDMSARRNILRDYAKSEFLLYLDSDETIHPDALNWMRTMWTAQVSRLQKPTNIVFMNLQMKDEYHYYEKWFGHTTVRAGQKKNIEWKGAIGETLQPGIICPYPILNWGNCILDWNREKFIRALSRWAEMPTGDSILQETATKSPSLAFDVLRGWSSVDIYSKIPPSMIPTVKPDGKI